ncbi:hypothetical protein IF1G_06092 [Cordyceps javanica]|uniref:Uncharacterized protein n=1 Tax=Cordyceps javanica TaxID=43265 RepID=A0A545V057_9HYPO|nr:hypothetical protein IF1G_06092 [Cordyceps javanica]
MSRSAEQKGTIVGGELASQSWKRDRKPCRIKIAATEQWDKQTKRKKEKKKKKKKSPGWVFFLLPLSSPSQLPVHKRVKIPDVAGWSWFITISSWRGGRGRDGFTQLNPMSASAQPCGRFGSSYQYNKTCLLPGYQAKKSEQLENQKEREKKKKRKGKEKTIHHLAGPGSFGQPVPFWQGRPSHAGQGTVKRPINNDTTFRPKGKALSLYTLSVPHRHHQISPPFVRERFSHLAAVVAPTLNMTVRHPPSRAAEQGQHRQIATNAEKKRKRVARVVSLSPPPHDFARLPPKRQFANDHDPPGPEYPAGTFACAQPCCPLSHGKEKKNLLQFLDAAMRRSCRWNQPIRLHQLQKERVPPPSHKKPSLAAARPRFVCDAQGPSSYSKLIIDPCSVPYRKLRARLKQPSTTVARRPPFLSTSLYLRAGKDEKDPGPDPATPPLVYSVEARQSALRKAQCSVMAPKKKANVTTCGKNPDRSSLRTKIVSSFGTAPH